FPFLASSSNAEKNLHTEILFDFKSNLPFSTEAKSMTHKGDIALKQREDNDPCLGRYSKRSSRARIRTLNTASKGRCVTVTPPGIRLWDHFTIYQRKESSNTAARCPSSDTAPFERRFPYPAGILYGSAGRMV